MKDENQYLEEESNSNVRKINKDKSKYWHEEVLEAGHPMGVGSISAEKIKVSVNRLNLSEPCAVVVMSINWAV